MQLMSNCNRSNEESVAPADKSLDFLATLLLFVCLFVYYTGSMMDFFFKLQTKKLKGTQQYFPV